MEIRTAGTRRRPAPLAATATLTAALALTACSGGAAAATGSARSVPSPTAAVPGLATAAASPAASASPAVTPTSIATRTYQGLPNGATGSAGPFATIGPGDMLTVTVYSPSNCPFVPVGLTVVSRGEVIVRIAGRGSTDGAMCGAGQVPFSSEIPLDPAAVDITPHLLVDADSGFGDVVKTPSGMAAMP
jgi:hypothetical protein